MKGTHKVVILGKADNLGIVQTPQLEQEGLVIDCPDCFDTMIKMYDLDKVRYQRENCDLSIGGEVYWDRL